MTWEIKDAILIEKDNEMAAKKVKSTEQITFVVLKHAKFQHDE